jgi:hypothetical protein
VTYYDTFELACGCRMHCTCPKVGTCDSCGKWGHIVHVGSHRWRCAAGCKQDHDAEVKQLREEVARLKAELAWRRARDVPEVYPAASREGCSDAP